MVGVALPGDEPGEQGGGQAEGDDRRRRGPAVLGSLDDGPDERADGGDRQDRAERVEALDRRVPRVGHERAAISTRATATTGTLIISTEPHQKCSSSQPPVTGPRATARPAVAAHTAIADGPLLGDGEDVDEDRQRGREHQRRADAHRGPPADQGVGRAGGRAEGGERGEQGQAAHQHPLAPDAVAEAAGGHQQAGEDEDVGVDDPLQLAGRGAELGGQRRQGDVDDRAVEHDDEHRRAQHAEDQPAAAVGGPWPVRRRADERRRSVGEPSGSWRASCRGTA